VGVGIDRLAMIVTNAESIKDVIPYPIVKRG
ncbi:MAG: amino acid--tRNA ligase-related protein, partial [Pyrobaculum sp.]